MPQENPPERPIRKELPSHDDRIRTETRSEMNRVLEIVDKNEGAVVIATAHKIIEHCQTVYRAMLEPNCRKTPDQCLAESFLSRPNKCFITRKDMPGLPVEQIEVRFENLDDGTRGHFEHPDRFVINRKIFLLKHNDQIQEMFKLSATIHHESEHMFHKGSAPADKSAQEYVRYCAHPGEIRAFARQSAFEFARHSSREFTVNEMTEIANRVGGNIKTYWAEFTKPEMQEKYADVENLSEVVKEMTRLTTGFLKQYKYVQD